MAKGSDKYPSIPIKEFPAASQALYPIIVLLFNIIV